MGDTQRQGTTTRTEFESSGGGKGTSVSDGLGRTTVGQSASGDLYAGHDGNVYKKTDSGWSKYDNNGWEQMDTPDRANSERSPESRSTGSRSTGSRSTAAADTARAGQSQTQAQPRDFSSDLQAQRDKQRGNSSSQQRSAGSYQGRSSMSRGSGATNYSSLNRDYSARKGGYDQFSQRRSGSSNWGSRSGARGGGRSGRRR